MTQMFKPPASARTHIRRQAYANYDRSTGSGRSALM